jgi:hypothetical protein
LSSASRQAFVAILYSHARSDPRPWKVPRRRHARRKRLLDEVLGLLEGAEHAIAVDVQLAPVTLDALGERRSVEVGVCNGGHAL